MVDFIQNDAGYGYTMIIKPEERELCKCYFCFAYFPEGYWCKNTKTLRCTKCQEKDRMMSCRGKDIEHEHILITEVKIIDPKKAIN